MAAGAAMVQRGDGCFTVPDEKRRGPARARGNVVAVGAGLIAGERVEFDQPADGPEAIAVLRRAG